MNCPDQSLTVTRNKTKQADQIVPAVNLPLPTSIFLVISNIGKFQSTLRASTWTFCCIRHNSYFILSHKHTRRT